MSKSRSKASSTLPFLLSTLAILSCQSRVGETDCTYGETCSHYPRAFLTVAPETEGENADLYGVSWASDSIFSTKQVVEVYTHKSGSSSEGYKDLWGPSAIASATPTNDDSQGYFYVTGALENTIAVIEKNFFSAFATLKSDQGISCNNSVSECDTSCQSSCYSRALSATSPISKVFRRSDFGHSYEVPIETLLAKPMDVVTWSREDAILIFVASRDGDQVSIFKQNNIIDTSTEEITLSYFGDIATEGPARLALLDPDPSDDEAQLVVMGASENQSCPDLAKLEAGELSDDELREDFLSIFNIVIEEDGLKTPTRKLVEMRSGSCYGISNCTENTALRGLWGMTALSETSGTTLFASNRCNNSILELGVNYETALSVTTVGLSHDRTYSLSDASIFEGCEAGPDNLGFKGIAANSNYVYVASWETGYLLEWPRGDSALELPNAICAIGGRCSLNKCTDVNANWYLRNDATAHFYKGEKRLQDTMRPFPHTLQLESGKLYFSLDRNSQMGVCTVAVTDDSTTKSMMPSELGLTSATSLSECEVLQ